jgi:hypothetical protein
MAEEVKIVDVAGGPAAEATLQEILRVLKGKGGTGGGGGGSATAAKAQDLYTTAVNRGTKVRKANTDAVKDATKATNLFSSSMSSITGLIGSAFGAVIGVTKNFTEALTNASTIGEVFEAVPLFGSALSSATGYFQTSVNTFRQLSDVGAGFGNDMMAMRSAAAQAGLSLDMFAEMVGNNSSTMGYLGGTTSDGAARMGRLTKALRSQEAGLMSLGYTQQSLNEGMAEYLENQALAGQLRGRTDASLIAGAQGYLTELDKLARVTGKSRKELQDAMRANAQTANVAVIRSRLSGEALQNFDNNLAHVTTMLPGMGDVFKDLSDGVAQSPFARVLESTVPGMKALAEANASGEISQEEFQRRLQELTPQIRDFITSMDPEQVEALMGREGLGDLMNVIGEVTTYSERQAQAQAAAAEAARRAPLTDLFANFEQTIQNIRSTFEDAFIDSGVLDFIGTELGEGGENLLAGFQAIANNVKEYLGSEQFKKDFNMVKTKVQEFKNTIMDFVDDVKEFGFMDAVSKLFEGTAAGGNGGMLGMIGDWLGDVLYGMLPDIDTLIVGALGAIGGTLAAGLLGALIGPIAAPFLAIGGALVAIFGWETVKGWVNDAWEAIKGVFTGLSDWWDTVDFTKPISDAWEKVKGFFSFGETSFSISQIASDAWNTVKGWFTFGEGESTFSISQIATDAWNTVTGWFSFGETNFSISEMATSMWNTVTGWFSFGETNFSISEMATSMWNTVTGWFTFGEGESSFSLSGLATSAWDTVKSWFSFEGVEMPSIKDAFNSIKEKVLGFFDFDFELPDFTDYLPTWLGGEGKSLFDGDEPGTTATAAVAQPTEAMPDINNPDNITRLATLDYGYQLEQAKLLKAELADIGSMQTFNTELERMQAGLDNTAIEAYNTSMQKLVDTLEELNDVLAEDNKGTFGGGTGVSAASMLSSGQLGGGSESGSSEQLDRLNTLVSQLIALQTEGNRYTRGTMRAVNGNLQVGV